MTFLEQLRAISRRNDSLLCVGLDSAVARLPEAIKGDESLSDDLLRFNRAIIAQTSDLVCAYKINPGFYLTLGPAGVWVLQETIRSIPPAIPAILDLKGGDIRNTAEQYARACFETFGCRAVTVNPLMGADAVAPFLEYRDRCTFVLCLTSNPGAADFELQSMADGQPLYRLIAGRIGQWLEQGSCGAVVAPVDKTIMQELRSILPNVPFLVPGIGAQSLDLETAVCHGTDRNGELALINVSRAILYASQDNDFDRAARRAARNYREAINRFR